MPWVQFVKNFDWSPARYNGRVTMAFPAGLKKLVTRECAEAAAKAGAIECKPENSASALPSPGEPKSMTGSETSKAIG